MSDIKDWPKNSCLYCTNCPDIRMSLRPPHEIWTSCEIWDSDVAGEGLTGKCKYFKEGTFKEEIQDGT